MTGHIQVGTDGFYHPTAESELVELIRWARAEGLQLRVRGAGHTFPPGAILTDHGPGSSPREINLLLDRYRSVEWLDRPNGILRAQAGCHLSVDPYDPLSRLENGLLAYLDEAGFALPTLGGISHQTVAGFLSTGSSGGTVKYHISDAVLEIRLIDGTGKIWELSRQNNPDLFHAAGVSMGLLGVISSVTFQGVPRFNIEGQEAITGYSDCKVDLFGSGGAGRPSLEQWLREIEEGRILWWPQKGLERLVVWEAQRIPWQPGFEPQPYQELGANAEISGVLAGVLLTLLGNLDDLRVVPAKLRPVFVQLDRSVQDELEQLGLPEAAATALAELLSRILEAGADGVLDFPGMKLVAHEVRKHLASIIPALYRLFVPLDRDARKGQPQTFRDFGWHGLPMDNGVDDQLLPSWFSELWFPLERMGEVVRTLKQHFEAGGLAATGTYSFEIYTSKKNDFWLSPSFGDQDHGRVNIFWFAHNAGDPNVFYDQFWRLLEPLGFRLHWGKFLPPDPAPAKHWARYFRSRYPRWDDFLALRRELDPSAVFLTQYWREHLGLEAA